MCVKHIVEAIAVGSVLLLRTDDGAHLNIVHERIAGFGIVLSLNEQQLIAQ